MKNFVTENRVTIIWEMEKIKEILKGR